MSTEINTRGAVRAKVSGFPSGNDAECLIKSEILNGSFRTAVLGSYEKTECPMNDDVRYIEKVTILNGTISMQGITQRVQIRIDINDDIFCLACILSYSVANDAFITYKDSLETYNKARMLISRIDINAISGEVTGIPNAAAVFIYDDSDSLYKMKLLTVTSATGRFANGNLNLSFSSIVYNGEATNQITITGQLQ